MRPPSPYDPVDAVYTAAALLCADGAGSAGRLRSAVDDYNHSGTYVDTVLTLALAFEQDPGHCGHRGGRPDLRRRATGHALPVGRDGPGGFDCSGLAQAAFAHAGVVLPRVAQDQYDAGPLVPAGAPVEPGDLVFFGGGATSVDHVGIYVGEGEMIDCPAHRGGGAVRRCRMVRTGRRHPSGVRPNGGDRRPAAPRPGRGPAISPSSWRRRWTPG